MHDMTKMHKRREPNHGGNIIAHSRKWQELDYKYGKLHLGRYTLLIPGPKNPGKDFDLFMEPLVEELQQLWKGVLTRDLYSSPPANFFPRAVIIWCIHDYPALGTMSGRTTHGYNACVRCDRNPLSYAILSKICYIGHRRFLAKEKPHPRKYRRHVFNAKHEKCDAPKR